MFQRLRRWRPSAWPLIAGGTMALLGAGATAGHGSAIGAPGTASPEGAATDERRATLFYTAEVHGAVEPCGCTSDPLGDVSRLVALVQDARNERHSRGAAGPRSQADGVALLDAGGLLYPEGAISARERPSADLRGEFLAAQLEGAGLIGAALGETDAAGGAAHVRPRRLGSNLSGAPAVIAAPRVQAVGGIGLGVLGIADPTVAGAIHAQAEDMIASARREVVALRKEGAEVVIILAAVEKVSARRLARDAGADVVVMGKRVGAGLPLMDRIGDTFLVAPGEEMQRVGRLDIVLRGPAAPGVKPALQDAGGPEAVRLRRDEINRSLGRLRGELSRWTAPAATTGRGGAADASASATDSMFLAQKQREKADLEQESSHLESVWTAPASGSYLVNALVPLRRSLRRDPKVVAAMKKLDQQIAAVNLKQAVPPPRAEPGRAFYVGTDRCARCHSAAVAFWRGTVHAHAWKTLVDGGKQADYKCIACHVTGFGQVGGSALGFTATLQNVQCETCHGPGSAHVAGEGNEEPLAIKRDTPEAACLGCHTEQHSDTFQYQAYLRDIVGPGHGPKRRDALGPGATGHQLRSRALAAARLAGAPQLKKK